MGVRGTPGTRTPSTHRAPTATMTRTAVPAISRHHAALLQMTRPNKMMKATATAGQLMCPSTR
jgi:hypothetical protein